MVVSLHDFHVVVRKSITLKLIVREPKLWLRVVDVPSSAGIQNLCSYVLLGDGGSLAFELCVKLVVAKLDHVVMRWFVARRLNLRARLCCRRVTFVELAKYGLGFCNAFFDGM